MMPILEVTKRVIFGTTGMYVKGIDKMGIMGMPSVLHVKGRT